MDNLRKYIKKAMVFVLACGLIVCTACSAGAGETGGGTLRIVTSFYPMYVFTARVIQGVEGISVHNMAAPEAGCLHDYQLLPADLRAIESADVLVVNGAGMEQFLDKVRIQYAGLPVIEASESIALFLEAEGGYEGEHTRDDGHDHAVNAHVWVDPRNAAVQTRTIARRLAELDPAHAAQYTANAEQYATELEALHARMFAALADLPNRDIVTFHEAFAYFAQAFELNVAAVIEREPGSEPGTRELAELVDTVRASGVQALFVEPQYPAGVAQIVARETDARIYTLDPVVTGPLEITAYEDAMERNLAALLEAMR